MKPGAAAELGIIPWQRQSVGWIVIDEASGSVAPAPEAMSVSRAQAPAPQHPAKPAVPQPVPDNLVVFPELAKEKSPHAHTEDEARATPAERDAWQLCVARSPQMCLLYLQSQDAAEPVAVLAESIMKACDLKVGAWFRYPPFQKAALPEQLKGLLPEALTIWWHQQAVTEGENLARYVLLADDSTAGIWLYLAECLQQDPARFTGLPTVMEMLEQPRLKAQAWEILKQR